jgi:hypothetical protein
MGTEGGGGSFASLGTCGQPVGSWPPAESCLLILLCSPGYLPGEDLSHRTCLCLETTPLSTLCSAKMLELATSGVVDQGTHQSPSCTCAPTHPLLFSPTPHLPPAQRGREGQKVGWGRPLLLSLRAALCACKLGVQHKGVRSQTQCSIKGPAGWLLLTPSGGSLIKVCTILSDIYWNVSDFF